MPIERAASTYCWRSTPWVAARARREKPGMKMMPIAIMAFRMLVPRLAIRITASRIAGNENSSSMSRISTMSIQTAEIGGEDADHRAADQADPDRDQRHLDRDARRVDGAREHVAAELVGAQPVRRAGPLEHDRDVELIGRIGRDPIGEQRGEQDATDQKPADQQQAMAAPDDAASGAPPER